MAKYPLLQEQALVAGTKQRRQAEKAGGLARQSGWVNNKRAIFYQQPLAQLTFTTR